MVNVTCGCGRKSQGACGQVGDNKYTRQRSSMGPRWTFIKMVRRSIYSKLHPLFNFNSLWSISLVHIQTVIFFKDMAPLFSADCQLVGFHTHKNVDLILATSMLQSGILEVWVKRCSTVSTDLHKYDPLYKMWKWIAAALPHKLKIRLAPGTQWGNKNEFM